MTADRGEAAAPRRHSARDVVDRIRARPAWLLHDLPPARDELAHPLDYWKGMRLWYRLRQEGYTMLGCRRGRYLHRLAAEADRDGVPGVLLDCGVWNGGSTVLLSTGAPLRTVWAFDSFEGLPEPGELDGEDSTGWAGACLGSEARVREAFETYADPTRLRVVKGWFADTYPGARADVGQVAVLHADGDWYQSVLLTLGTFCPSVAPGGFVIVDDYGLWRGARQATDEYRKDAGIDAPLRPIDGNAVYWRQP